MVNLEEWVRTRAQRVQNPSKRTPDRETHHNLADTIEAQLQEDGHKTWGWIIYRCTYESETEWQAFMTRLRFYINDTLEQHNGLDILDSLNYHVFEDRALFDGAHPSAVREHFRKWTTMAPQQEQGTEADRSQRYNYCIHVDQAALQLILSGPAPPEDDLGNGFVNLICLNVLGGMRPEHTEGRDKRDHCWMRITYQDYVVWYSLLRKQATWFTVYRVPPEVGRP